MSTTFREFDGTMEALINPADGIRKIPDFPQVCVSTFSEKILDRFIHREGTERIGLLWSAGGNNPVYRMMYKGTAVAFYLSRVGAPACVGSLEEVIAQGARRYVLFGICGVLDASIADGEIILPTSALRDEGTSYHYLPFSDEVEQDAHSLEVMRGVLEEQGYSYTEGKTWTTDAFYRETRGKAEDRRRCGCVAVEMECASMLAAAKFRGVSFAQFLYSGDNLDAEVWDPRGLRGHGESKAEQYMEIALECAVRL